MFIFVISILIGLLIIIFTIAFIDAKINMHSKKRKCKSCTYFVKSSVERQGYCHYNPPQINHNSPDSPGIYPIVLENTISCSNFE